MSVSQAPGGANIGIESRVGFRVMTRVTGELSPSAAIDDISASYALSWNPFEPGSLDVTYDAVNDGNTHLTVDAGVEAAGRTEQSRSSNGRPGPAELLPGDRRSLNATVTRVWPLGIVTGKVTLVSASAEGDPAAVACLDGRLPAGRSHRPVRSHRPARGHLDPRRPPDHPSHPERRATHGRTG
ncbi:hypothetical protein [Parafrankia sp. FMc2]|uniref:hypothetical protein n=1 Tax=Parafrankia sp. FMc2 TaxID=3233196 RepID=UPI0034D48CD4